MEELNVEQLINKKIELNLNLLDKNLSGHMEAKVKKAKEMVLWVINDHRLRKFILDFKASDGTVGFKQTDKDNIWHLRRFVCANERGLFKTDYEWDIKLNFYFKRFSRVLGYTNRGSTTINSNTKYSYGMDIYDFCANIIHEMCHIYGMHHSFSRSSLWPDTAPYAIGNFSAELIEKYYGKDEETNEEIDETNVPERKIKSPSIWYRIKLFFKRLF